jgi:hypothetical protein
VSKGATTGKYPAGAWEGLRVFDISDPEDPYQGAAVYQASNRSGRHGSK